MSAFYDRLNETARRLIEKYGKAATIIRNTSSGPAYAPVLTPVSHGCKLVDIGYKLTLIPQTLIQLGDKMGIISTDLDITPGLPDKLVIDGGQYNFVAVQPLNPGGTTLLYEYLARK